MQGHFMDMKSAYIFGLLQALQNYDPEKGASFNSFQRRLKILCEAFDNLEYRERAIVAEHLGFCESCWTPYYNVY